MQIFTQFLGGTKLCLPRCLTSLPNLLAVHDETHYLGVQCIKVRLPDEGTDNALTARPQHHPTHSLSWFRVQRPPKIPREIHTIPCVKVENTTVPSSRHELTLV